MTHIDTSKINNNDIKLGEGLIEASNSSICNDKLYIYAQGVLCTLVGDAYILIQDQPTACSSEHRLGKAMQNYYQAYHAFNTIDELKLASYVHARLELAHWYRYLLFLINDIHSLIAKAASSSESSSMQGETENKDKNQQQQQRERLETLNQAKQLCEEIMFFDAFTASAMYVKTLGVIVNVHESYGENELANKWNSVREKYKVMMKRVKCNGSGGEKDETVLLEALRRHVKSWCELFLSENLCVGNNDNNKDSISVSNPGASIGIIGSNRSTSSAVTVAGKKSNNHHKKHCIIS